MTLNIDVMKKVATHKNALTGTLYKLSTPDDDFPDSALWLNEASLTWQVSPFTNGEIKHGRSFIALS